MNNGEDVRTGKDVMVERLRELERPNVERIKAIRAGTYEPKLTIDELEHTPNECVLRAWDAMKGERHDLINFLVANTWRVEEFADKRRELADRAPAEDTDINSQWRAVAEETEKIFEQQLYAYLESARTDEGSPDQKAYNRLRDVLSFALMKIDETRISFESPYQFIRVGIRTGRNAGWGMAKLIPQLFTEAHIELEDGQLADCLNHPRTRTTIGELSWLNIGIAPDIMEAIRRKDGQQPGDYSLDHNFFQLETDQQGQHFISLNYEELHKAKFLKGPLQGTSILETKSRAETHGCPVGYDDEGKGGTITEYMDWVAEIAEKRFYPLIEKKAQDSAA